MPSVAPRLRSSLVDLQKEIEDASKGAATAARRLALLQGELQDRVALLEPTAPSPLVRESVTNASQAWDIAVAEWKREVDVLSSAWRRAAEEIEMSTGVLAPTQPSLDAPLTRLGDEHLESQATVLRAALLACETWNTLRAKAEGTEFDGLILPEGITVEGLPEAVAVRQVKAREALERLVAPRLLCNRLSECCAKASNTPSADVLLSASDWQTLADASGSTAVRGPLRGLVLRRLVDIQPENLVIEAKRLWNALNSEAGGNELEALSFLSCEQFSRLWAEFPEGMPMTQAALVRGLCISRRLECWFWEPLVMFARQDFRPMNDWDSLLFQIAEITVRRDGFARFGALVSEMRGAALGGPPNPERAWQDLWAHLSLPIRCNDGSRYRLRQMAHERLFDTLRKAVKDRELAAAISGREIIRQNDLDELYDRWSKEIGLCTRSLRDHFREDVEKVLQLVGNWESASGPTVEKSEERFRILIQGCLDVARNNGALATDDKARAAFGRWLLTFGTDAARGFTADFPAEHANFSLQQIPQTVTLEPTEWRAFGAQVERGAATWGEWSLDQLADWSGDVGPDMTVRRMLELKYFVAASQAVAMFAAHKQSVAPALVEQIEAEILRSRTDLAAELDSLRTELARLRPADRQMIEAEMPIVPEPPTISARNTFTLELSALQQLVAQTLADYADGAKRRELAEQLVALGRHPRSEASLDELQMAWRIAWDETAPKRRHLSPIREFRDFVRQAGIAELTGAADAALASLETPEHWRCLEDTTDLELYFDALFLEQLRSVLVLGDRLKPEYGSNLLKLTKSWLGALNAPVWISDPASPWWQALRRTVDEDLAKSNPGQALGVLMGLSLSVEIERPPQQATLLPRVSGQAKLPERQVITPTRATSLEGLRAALDVFMPEAGIAPLPPLDLRRALIESRWETAVKLAGGEYRRLEERGQAAGKYGRELLVDLGAAVVLSLPDERPLDLDATAVLLHAINATPDSAVRTEPGAADRLGCLFERCFLDAWATEFVLREPLRERVAEQFRSYARTLSTDSLPGRLNRWLASAFTPCAADPKIRCPMVDAAWSQSDTAVRGWLLGICLQTDNWSALQRLLVLSNPEVMSAEQAEYFRLLVGDRERNWLRFASFIADLRMRSPKRPTFLNFTERLLQSRQVVMAPLLRVELLDKLQPQRDGRTWLGQIHIEPSEIDPPATLLLSLPESGDLRFTPGRVLEKPIEGGPFLHPLDIYCEFAVESQTADLRFQVRCTGKTLSDRPFELVQEWEARVRSEFFDTPDPEEINRIFRDFSPNPVTGANYVRRPWDERALRQLLLLSQKPGSVWMRAPRRSGKTSLLLRLIEEHSCRADRPTNSGLIHINVASWSHSERSLGRHVWEEFWGGTRNADFRRNFPSETESRGEALTRKDNVGFFLQAFADFLIAECPNPLERIYFLFDEVDPLRELHFKGGANGREICRVLLWQIRALVQSSDNVGVVFASPPSVDGLFASQPEAPFYNSIKRYPLEPFSLDTEEKEHASRSILQPAPLSERFEKLPRETVLHLLRITRGLPYYMHHAAGATYAVARSRYISRSDVNRAMELLLQRRIGLASQQLDRPGLDELSVLDGEGDPRRRILAKGVLLAAANLLNGFDHPYLLRNDLLRTDGPLKIEARLPDTFIREGLDLLLEYGFLITPAERSLHLEFFIPILGESLRAEFRTQWNDILNRLEELASATIAPASRSFGVSKGEVGELRDRVEKFLQREIVQRETDRREFFIAEVGARLLGEFPGTSMHERLGFPKLIDLLRSFDAFLVTGDPQREVLRRATTEDLRSFTIRLILELIDRWDEEGRHLTAAVLGNQLLMRFPNAPVYQQLGHSRLLEFLHSIPEVVVEGTGIHRVIRRARPEGERIWP